MSDVIVRLKQVLAETGVSRSTAYAKFTADSKYYDPLFPKPVKLGARSIGFRASELASWKDSLKNAA
jgi:prophage regulatory protein